MSVKSEIKKNELIRTQTSPVWSYFKVSEENAVMADCLLCGVRMSRGGNAPNRCGTTNLRRHILYTHQITLPSSNKRTTVDDIPRKVYKRKTKTVKKSRSVLNKSPNRKKTNQCVKKSSNSPVLKNKVKKAKEESEKSEIQPEPVMCIKWNTYLSNMTSALPHLLHDEQFVDVTLACEGQSLKCHKILLAACSPYFYDLLSASSCRHPIIMFKDYHFWELQALVAFMYCGEVNVPQSQLPRILRVAEALQIKGLAKPASKLEPPSDNDQAVTEVDNIEPLCALPQPADNKRKRKPSLHNNCCKNSPNTTKSKHNSTAVKSRGKSKVIKRKSITSTTQLLKPAKDASSASEGVLLPLPPESEPVLHLLHLKKSMKHALTKAASKKESLRSATEEKTPLALSSLDQNCPQLPELLPSDMPDMLSDILAMKDTAGISEGISLPEAHKVGSVDGIFPLEDLEQMEMDEDSPGIVPFLTNGLHHDDQFDLLPHINPECRLDDDGDGR